MFISRRGNWHKNLERRDFTAKNNVLNLNNDLHSLKSRKTTLNISLELLNPKIERLKKKNKLLDIKKKFNDELLWANRDKLEKEIIKIEEIVKNVKLALEGIKKKKESSDKEINALSNKISSKEHNINKLSKQLGEFGYKKQDLIAKIQNWQKDKVLAKQELDTLSNKIDKIQKIINNFEQQKVSLENEIKVIKTESRNAGLQIDKLINEQNQLIKKIKQNKVLLDKYDQINTEKKERLTNIQENEKSIKAYNNEINQLFQSFKDIEHKLEKNKWFLENPTKDLLIQLDRELKRTSLKVYEIDSEIKQLEFTISKKFKK